MVILVLKEFKVQMGQQVPKVNQDHAVWKESEETEVARVRRDQKERKVQKD